MVESTSVNAVSPMHIANAATKSNGPCFFFWIKMLPISTGTNLQHLNITGNNSGDLGFIDYKGQKKYYKETGEKFWKEERIVIKGRTLRDVAYLESDNSNTPSLNWRIPWCQVLKTLAKSMYSTVCVVQLPHRCFECVAPHIQTVYNSRIEPMSNTIHTA